jgi:acyl carrier protein
MSPSMLADGTDHAATDNSRRAELMHRVVSEIATFLSVDPGEIDIHESLTEWGLDSLQLVDLRLKLEQALGCRLNAELLAADPRPATLVQSLLEQSLSEQASVEATTDRLSRAPIAIDEATAARLRATPVPLNMLDKLLARTHIALQRLGDVGLPLQYHMWLQGRIDRAALQRAIDAIVVRWPVLSSLLDLEQGVWRYSVAAAPTIEERTVTDATETAVLRATEAVLAERCDLSAGPQLRFVIVRRPDAGEVLLLQIPHPLIDVQGAEALLRLLLGLGEPPASIADQSHLGPDSFDALCDDRRLANFLRVLKEVIRRPFSSFIRLPARLLPADFKPTSAGRLRLEWLDERRTAALNELVQSFGPAVPMTMVLAAIGLRVVQGMQADPSARLCRMRIPFSLRLGRDRFVPFKNLAGAATLRVPVELLADFPALVRTLAMQFAEQRDPRDRAFSYWRAKFAERSLRHSSRRITAQYAQSLHTTFVGELVPAGTSAFGSVVERAYATMVALPEARMSVSLWPVSSRQQVCFLYPPDVMDPAVVDQFVARWFAELDTVLQRQVLPV